jgi:hypothetical protein
VQAWRSCRTPVAVERWSPAALIDFARATLVAMPVPLLLLTGTVRVGKSTVAAAINDELAERQIPNAAVDLDALVWQWPPDSPWNHRLMLDNLGAIWPNFVARRVTHLVLARPRGPS